jgi:hypothetical protein
MVDQARRKKLVFHLRQLSVGIISNDQFENSIMDEITSGWLPEQYYRSEYAKSDDPIVIPMLELCWGLYDDTRKHKLINSDRLPDESLKTIARCILFLRSDKSYEWPRFDTGSYSYKFSFKDFIFAIFTFGYTFRKKRIVQKQLLKDYQNLGDYDYWPFLRKYDYTSKLEKQPFLNPQ